MEDFFDLETERLRLRHFKAEDLTPFLTYRNDPIVARYQGWSATSAAEAQVFIDEQKIGQPGLPGEWFQIAIELKETGTLAGDCGLKIERHDIRQGEIGYTLAQSYQRQGIAMEAVTCILDYAFSQLHLHRIIAHIDVENIASLALLERLGFRREGHFIQNAWFKGRWCDEYLYAMLQRDWQAKRGLS